MGETMYAKEWAQGDLVEALRTLIKRVVKRGTPQVHGKWDWGSHT